jgi:hypothetical protein
MVRLPSPTRPCVLSLCRSIGVPPTQALANDLDYVKRVCQDYPLNLMQNIIHARAGKPFRYVHVSGVICQRDQTKRPLWKPDYCLLGVCVCLYSPDFLVTFEQGRMETTILVQRGAASGFDVCVARPGMVTERRTLKHVLTSVTFMPAIDIRELAAALLHQAYVGFEKDTVENRELMQVGRAALRLNV